MPIVNGDVKSLEMVVAAEYFNDHILKQEILDRVDIHEANRLAFGLPSRLIAKVFIFRIVYGGSAYSYAHDPDFMGVSTSEKFWQEVIDSFYNKYKGIKQGHDKLVQICQEKGFLEIPSGRYYPFAPEKSWNGWKWPLTKMKNYPIQGFGADLVMLARIELLRLLDEASIEADFIGTIHDSLVVDCPTENVGEVAQMIRNAIESVPRLCRTIWNYDFSLPITCEILVGPNKADMKEFA